MDPARSRRQFLRAVLAGSAAGLAGCTGRDLAKTDPQPRDADPSPTGTTTADTPPEGAPPDAVGLETVAADFQAALDVAFAPEAGHLYIAEQGGDVLVHGPDGVRDEPFFDLSDSVEAGGEKGLLGFELHPDFADNRRCYVRYSTPSGGDVPAEYSHLFVLAEFTASDDGLRADLDSERVILEIPQPQGNHNAGDLEFDGEGLLYVAVGDGGAGGDQGLGHVDDWYDAVAGGNGQDVTENLLGSILRIDVDGREGDRPYAVPEDNPLVEEEGLDEHYAWGFRNPWRMSIDPEGERVDGGPDLYVGDVGQNRFEEVDLVRPGGNYGWNVKEASHCFGDDDCPGETPDDVRGGEPLLDPVVEYPHEGAAVSGISVIGGYLYRGESVPGLQGRYVFGDWQADDRLFVAEPREDGLWETAVLDVTGSGTLQQVRSFGRDHDGEVYVVASDGETWDVHRLVEA